MEYKHKCLRCEDSWNSNKENPISCGKCMSRSWRVSKTPKKEKFIRVGKKNVRIIEEELNNLKKIQYGIFHRTKFNVSLGNIKTLLQTKNEKEIYIGFENVRKDLTNFIESKGGKK